MNDDRNGPVFLIWPDEKGHLNLVIENTTLIETREGLLEPGLSMHPFEVLALIAGLTEGLARQLGGSISSEPIAEEEGED